MQAALFRSDDSVHLLLHHRANAPVAIQTTIGPWEPLGWIEVDALPAPLRSQVMHDLTTEFYAVLPAHEAPSVARLASKR